MARKTIIVETPMASIPIQTQTTPVDIAVAPVRKSGGLAANILDSLKGLNPAIQSYLDLQEANVKANRDLGAMDRILGRTPNAPNSYRNLGWGYNQGFATLDGEIRGIRISQEYAQALEANNYFIDDPDPVSAQSRRQKLFEEISGATLQGTTNVDVLAGASQRILKTAVDTEEEAHRRFQSAKYTKVIEHARQIVGDTVVSLRSVISEMRFKPKEQQNWTPIRDQLTSLKQVLEAEQMPPDAASAILIDAWGEAAIGASNGDTGLAMTMLGILDQPDSSGVVYARLPKVMPDGTIKYPLRDQIDKVKRDVGAIIEDQKAGIGAAAKIKYQQQEAQMIDIMLKGGAHEDWYKIAKQAAAEGANVNWSFLNTLWTTRSHGGDPTAVTDQTLLSEIYGDLQNGRMISPATIQKYHEDKRLSIHDKDAIMRDLPTYAKMRTDADRNTNEARRLNAADKQQTKDDIEFAVSNYNTHVLVSYRKALIEGNAPKVKAGLALFKDTYKTCRDSGLSDTAARARAADTAKAYFVKERIAEQSAPETAAEDDKRFKDAIEGVRGLNPRRPLSNANK